MQRPSKPTLPVPPLGPGAAMSRDETLRPLLDRLSGAPAAVDEDMPGRAVDKVVPDPALRALLLADPALAALLPNVRGTLAFDADAAPFRVGPSTIGLAPGLAASPGALVAAARWAIEVADAADAALPARARRAVLALDHGAALAHALGAADRRAFLAALPGGLHDRLAAVPPAAGAAPLPTALPPSR